MIGVIGDLGLLKGPTIGTLGVTLRLSLDLMKAPGKKSSLFSVLVCCLATVASGQDHLTPEPGIFGDEHDYFVKVREVFAEVYLTKVILQVVVLPSFQPEEIAGIRKTDAGFEAFVAKPSSIIWETYTIYEEETEEQRQADREGKDFPLDPNSELAKMKRQSPSDFRKITIHTDARPISVPVKERIERAWQKMLLAARHPKTPRLGLDGVEFHFSMFIIEHGIVTAEVWSPDRGKARAFTELAEALIEFARWGTDEAKLKSLLKPLER